MKILCSIVLMLVLAVAAATVTGAHIPLLQKVIPHFSNPIPDVSGSQEDGEDVIIAMVKSIDYQHGLVHLDSEIGQILTFATPEALQDLSTGDLVVVHVVEENVEDNVVQDIVVA
jgi:hypothetical protein